MKLLIALMFGLTAAANQAAAAQVDNPIPHTDVQCLAYNLYHEARNQDEIGLIAVANVTINRVISDSFPDNICDVVLQGPTRESWNAEGVFYPVKNRCQFSWWCDGKDDTPYEKGKWNLALALANNILKADTYKDVTGGALYYHTNYVSPYWANGIRWPNGLCANQSTVIDDHIFYILSSNCIDPAAEEAEG